MNSDKLPYKLPLSPTSTVVKCVKEIISRTWNLSQKLAKYNPSPNPISLERKHLNLLKDNSHNYVVAEKSDGVRYTLILGRDRFNNNTPFSVMVNRKLQVYQIPIDAHPDYFEGSVFDGELVLEVLPHMDQTRQVFLIFDTYMSKNKSFMHLPLLDRYKEYNRVFDTNKADIINDDIRKWANIAREHAKLDRIVSLGNHKAMMFRPKQVVEFTNLGSLWRSVTRLTHPSDGLILTPKSTKVMSGTHNTMFKWKPSHTIDLLVTSNYQGGMWHYELFFMDASQVISCSQYKFGVLQKEYTLSINPNNERLSNTSRYYGDKNKTSYRLIGEFKCVLMNDGTVTCELERWRNDKSTPNNRFVIERTLVNIKEDISIKELLELTSLQTYGFST